ncbi:FAD binding domain-containing protein [Paenibacillus sinopodophylli]|uniref:FAD binding domain-containing protein n=1 Tax=Paenibacillus sinopodophylli TaxID=1837342 RepID=UPI001485E792|nr:FAD binding domain-containing protein [Paenibacillus sinopodophylli]
MGMNVQETIASPQVWHPQTAAEAWHLKQSLGTDSIYVSGGTLLRTQWEAGIAAMPKHFINLSSIRGLSEIRVGESGLIIGGQVKLQACRMNTMIQRYFPMLTEALRLTAAPSIRQLATLGGNIASSIGDSLPALLGYDAEVVWFNGIEEQLILLKDWLQIARNLHPERLLLRVQLPFQQREEADGLEPGHEELVHSKTKRFYAYHKVGRREAFTPSVVTVSISGILTEARIVKDIRIALGGGQMIPIRLEQLERELIGETVDTQTIRHAYGRVVQLYEPREDIFASSAYRQTTAANVIAAELWKIAAEA